MAPTPAARGTEHRSRSFVHLLADICRRFPDLEDWLTEDFARNSKTRANFLALVQNRQSEDQPEIDSFADLAGEAGSWVEEKRRLRAQFSPHAARLFGGLTWHEMETLIRRYEARMIGLEAFLLVRDWRKAGEAGKDSPQLLRRGANFLDNVIRSAERRSLRHLGNAVAMFAGLKKSRVSAAFGFAEWWKLHALIFMLRRPQETYRTRDVREHLATLGLDVSSLDFRRFCKRHGIRRNERAGRPRRLK